MNFSEIKKGDWFVSPADDIAVFIKIDDMHGYALSNHQLFEFGSKCEEITMDSEDEVIEFCGHFIWDRNTEDTARYESYGENRSSSTNQFSEIEVGDIYKGKGDTWYRKISDSDSLVIWSVNADTMGNIYSRKPTSKGTFSICHYWEFRFPERDFLADSKSGFFF